MSSTRERVLSVLLGGFILVAILGGLYYLFIYSPLMETQGLLDSTQTEILKKQVELAQERKKNKTLEENAPRLSKWDVLSLPEPLKKDPQDEVRFTGNLHLEYEKYLDSMFRKLGFISGNNGTFKIYSKDPPMPVVARPGSSSPGATGAGGVRSNASKGPPYKTLNYTAVANGSYEALLKLLREFHQAPVLHEVKSMTLERLNPTGKSGPPTKDLKLTLNIEVLQVQGAEKLDGKKRATILADQGRLGGLAILPSQYADFQPLLKDNMFLGKPPPPKPIPTVRKPERLKDMPEALVREEVVPPTPTKPREDLRDVAGFVRLTTIAYNETDWMATFVNQAVIGEQTLTMNGSARFEIKDKYENVLVSGEVINISTTLGIYFKAADGNIYHWKLRESLYDAMQRPLDVLAVTDTVVMVQNCDDIKGPAVLSMGAVSEPYSPRPALEYGLGVGVGGMVTSQAHKIAGPGKTETPGTISSPMTKPKFNLFGSSPATER